MVSSLAAQLVQQASQNSEVLNSQSRRRHYAHSYLFSEYDGGQHDLDSIYGLGHNGYAALSSLDPSITKTGDVLFSEVARSLDRTVIPLDDAKELKSTIGLFLRQISRYFLQTPTGNVIEWLVRRFRINEFDITEVVSAFLPFHNSAQFSKMLSILDIKPNTMWSFLLRFKSPPSPVTRTSVVSEMVKNSELARLIASLGPTAIEEGNLFPALIGFNTGIMVDYVVRLRRIEEGTLAIILPAVTSALVLRANKEAMLGSFVILGTLSRKVQLKPKVIEAVTTVMTNALSHVEEHQFIAALIAFCGPQDQFSSLPDVVVDYMLSEPALINTISTTLRWQHSSKFYMGLIGAIQCESFESFCPVIRQITTAPTFSPSLIEQLILLLFRKFGGKELAENDSMQHEITIISQRHPSPFREATRSYSQTLDKTTMQEFEKVLATLTFGSELSAAVDALTAARSDVPEVRLRGFRDLLASIDVSSKHETETGTVRDIIEAGLSDTETSVVNLIYQTPEAIFQLFSNKYLLSSVVNALHSHEASRGVIRLHLSFLAKTLTVKDPSASTAIIVDAFLPYLLFSKSRQKLASQVWNIIEDSPLKDHSLLQGCFIPLGQEATPQWMEATNEALASRLAENIASSEDHSNYSSTFLSRINDSDSHTRLFACLVVRSLIGSSPVERQIHYAYEIIRHIGLEHLDDLKDVSTGAKTLGEFISYEAFGSSIVMKPSHLSTFRRVQASLLALLPSVCAPIEGKLEWLSSAFNKEDNGDCFVHLTRMLYRLANLSLSLHSLSTSLLRAIFVNLKENALLFLTGVWSNGFNDQASLSINVAALNHAKAFLMAHASSQGSEKIDFQVILPALILALHFPDHQIRHLAVECITIISTISSGKRTAVYALDSVYGAKSENVQILDFGDVEKYTKLISRFSDSLATDPGYAKVIHQEHFCTHPNDNKKQRSYKQRLLCFFSSHCLAWNNMEARLTILSLIEPMHDPTKLHILLPLVKELVDQPQDMPRLLRELTDEKRYLYYQLLFGAFHPNCASDLKGNVDGVWDVFKQAIGASMDPNANSWISHAPLHQLTILYSALDFDSKLEISKLLLEFVALSPRKDENTSVRRALAGLLKDDSIAIALLNTWVPQPDDDKPRPAKRAKVTGDALTSDEDKNTKLMLLAEVLSTREGGGSPELINALVDSLRKLISAHDPSKSEYDYIEQLLLNVLDSSIVRDPSSSFTHDSLRVDVLIDLIRVTNNSQTFQQALLVISNVARVAPDSVLQNVMSIFTFMGSNVFHRDDTYSFRVVQKTIDSIVPVMVSSLKKQFNTGMDLFIGSRDFLRVFTDASTHVPRHRRTQFYNHLIDVVGPDDYLAPVCMLLVEKSAIRALRPKDGDAAQALTLPLATINNHPQELRLEVLCEMVREAQRLVACVEDPEAEDRVSFLEATIDEHSSPKGSLKKKILALLTFVSLAVQGLVDGPRHEPPPSNGPNVRIQELVSLLVAFSRVKLESNPSELEEINKATQRSLSKVMTIVTATDFIQSIASMLEVEDSKVQEGALDLFADRLPNVSPQTREKSGSMVIRIIEKMCSFLLPEKEHVSFLSTLRALKVTAATGPSSEDGALSRSTSAVISLARRPTISEAALTTLNTLIPKLGPRMIPHLKPIVQASVKSLQLKSDDVDGSLRDEALRVLTSIVSTTSSFLGEEMLLVITSCISLSADGDPDAEDVLETIAEKIPGRTLIPLLVKLWDTEYGLQTSEPDQIVSFFDFCKDSLAKSPREDIMEHLKPLFKMFLGAFGLRLALPVEDIEDVETAVAGAFLEIVTKLNETSFKPLFRKWFDWAFASGLDQRTSATRQTTFTRVMGSLIETFKNLITPYMITLLDPIIHLLGQFGDGTTSNPDLWDSVIQMLSGSFVFDEGVFWRDDRLEKLSQKLIKQISVSLSLEPPTNGDSDEEQAIDNRHYRTTLVSCLAHFAHAISREDLLKSFNLSLLMESRSEDPKVQLLVLNCVSEIWKKENTRLFPFVSETMTFVEDLAESEHDEVARESRAFKRVMEAVNGGPIDAMDM